MKRMKMILVLLVVWCFAARAETDILDRYAHSWSDGTTEVMFLPEDDGVSCLITREDGDDTLVWDYSMGWYDEEENALLCVNLERYRERLNEQTGEIEEVDWSLNDMEYAVFTLSEDGQTLTASDIEGIDEALVLRRQEP